MKQVEFTLLYCPKCSQMTNHVDLVCQKCTIKSKKQLLITFAKLEIKEWTKFLREVEKMK